MALKQIKKRVIVQEKIERKILWARKERKEKQR